MDSSHSSKEFLHSEESFDYEHVSDFDYEPVEFSFRTPLGGFELSKYRSPLEEHTLAVIKPSAFKYSSEIKRRIQDEGFTILRERIVRVSPEMVSEFFQDHYGKTWFPKVVNKLSKSPWIVLPLAKDNAIADFKELMGPPRVSLARKLAPLSLRAMYGLRGDFATNGIHGSEDREHALREIHFFFPQAIIEPVAGVMRHMDYYKERFHFLLIKSIGELYRYKTPDLLTWLCNWLDKNNPELPKMIVNYPNEEPPPAPKLVSRCINF